jgi:hypothetical protein
MAGIYAVPIEMGSGAMTCLSITIRKGSVIQKLMGGGFTDRQRARRSYKPTSVQEAEKQNVNVQSEFKKFKI